MSDEHDEREAAMRSFTVSNLSELRDARDCHFEHALFMGEKLPKKWQAVEGECPNGCCKFIGLHDIVNDEVYHLMTVPKGMPFDVGLSDEQVAYEGRKRAATLN